MNFGRQPNVPNALISAYREGLGLAAVILIAGENGARLMCCAEAPALAAGEAVQARWWCRSAEQAEWVVKAAVRAAQRSDADRRARRGGRRQARVLLLKRPSIINGSQTQGELRRYIEQYGKAEDFFEPSIKFELIVTTDDDLIAEISISRNFQNDVRAISIAGRRGQLDELEAAVQKVIPDVKLRKSETDLAVDDEFLDTEKLIQVLFALMPRELFELLEKDAASKVFAYSQKTRCLKLFQRIVEGQKGDPNLRAIYFYFLDMAGHAWKLYEKWKMHPLFRGTRLRSIERENGEVASVPDGIVFPILSAMSVFVTSRIVKQQLNQPRRRWAMTPVAHFDEQEIIDAAAQVYMEIADHNPQTMGKSKACYSALERITTIYARLAPEMLRRA